jgi:2-hydroxy-3-oxopropionate reductase
MVPNSPHVKAAVLGPKGVIEGAKAGSLVVDMSSIDPTVSKEVGAELAKKNIRFVDAPVSGGEPKAIDGSLSIMCGGKKADFDEALPILKCMGASVVLCGDIGAGNVTKLANQIVVALNIAARSEAMVLATKAGVDPQLVFDAIKGGLRRTVMNAKPPMMRIGTSSRASRINLRIKDLTTPWPRSRGGVPLALTGQAGDHGGLKVDGIDATTGHRPLLREAQDRGQAEELGRGCQGKIHDNGRASLPRPLSSPAFRVGRRQAERNGGGIAGPDCPRTPGARRSRLAFTPGRPHRTAAPCRRRLAPRARWVGLGT